MAVRTRITPPVRAQIYRDTLLAAALRTARGVDTHGTPAIWRGRVRGRPPDEGGDDGFVRAAAAWLS